MTEKLESQPQSDSNSYFGSQSTWGVTKHMGGLDATIFLADQCKVDKTTARACCGMRFRCFFLFPGTHLWLSVDRN